MVSITLNHDNLQYVNGKMLVGVLYQLPFEEMCVLAKKYKRIESFCLQIWQHDSFYHISLNDKDNTLSPGAHLYFICKNAKNFHSLQIYTSNFKIFNASTENLILSNLKIVDIVLDSDLSKLIPADFLVRCPMVKYIQITQPTAEFNLNIIVELKSLKHLKICHKDGNVTDDFLEEIITLKVGSIKSIQKEKESTTLSFA